MQRLYSKVSEQQNRCKKSTSAATTRTYTERKAQNIADRLFWHYRGICRVKCEGLLQPICQSDLWLNSFTLSITISSCNSTYQSWMHNFPYLYSSFKRKLQFYAQHLLSRMVGIWLPAKFKVDLLRRFGMHAWAIYSLHAFHHTSTNFHWISYKLFLRESMRVTNSLNWNQFLWNISASRGKAWVMKMCKHCLVSRYRAYQRNTMSKRSQLSTDQ